MNVYSVIAIGGLLFAGPTTCSPVIEQEPAGITCNVDEYHANGNACPDNPTNDPHLGWSVDYCLIYNENGTGTSNVGATPCDMTWPRGYRDVRVSATPPAESQTG